MNIKCYKVTCTLQIGKLRHRGLHHWLRVMWLQSSGKALTLGDWKDGLVAKSTYRSCRGDEFSSQHPDRDGSQYPIIPAP